MKITKDFTRVLLIGLTCNIILNCSFIQNFVSSTNKPLTEPSITAQYSTNTMPAATNTLLPTSTITPTITLTPMPVWVHDFAEPILKTVANRSPDFEDNFSNSIKAWKCQWAAWFTGGMYAIEEGVLRFTMSQGCAFCEHKTINQKDFVLQVDARLAEGNLDSWMLVYFHNITGDYWYVVELYGGTSWDITKMWAAKSHPIASGSDYVSPIGKTNHLTIIARGPEAAVYLNEIPLAYFHDVDFDTLGKTLFMCSSKSHRTICEFDNVKFWKL
jgi:hypothetical protein